MSEYGQYLDLDRVRVQWDELGEGFTGDYNPDDPDDIELLRFSVYYFDGDDPTLAHAQRDPEFAGLLAADGLGWIECDDASYCTNVPVSTPLDVRQSLLELLMHEFYGPVTDRQSVKKLGERLSWIDPSWATSAREAWVRKTAFAFFVANVAEAEGDSFDLPASMTVGEARAIAQRLYDAELTAVQLRSSDPYS